MEKVVDPTFIKCYTATRPLSIKGLCIKGLCMAVDQFTHRQHIIVLADPIKKTSERFLVRCKFRMVALLTNWQNPMKHENTCA